MEIETENTATPETGTSVDWSNPREAANAIADQIPDMDEEGNEVEATSDGTSPEGVDPAKSTDGEATPSSQELSKHRVRVSDTEEVEVTLDELTKGYSRERDYTYKTEQLSKERKQMETAYLAALNTVETMMTHFDPFLEEAKTINWTELAQQDQSAYVAKKAMYEDRVHKWNAIQQEKARLQNAALDDYARNEFVELQRVMPELKDETKRKEIHAGISQFLKDSKFSEAEITGLRDHRQFLVSYKAMQWDKHQAALKAAGEKKVLPKATRVVNPRGAAPAKPSGSQSISKAIKPGMSMRQQAELIAASLNENEE